jgi:hypothetical protein
MIMPYTITIRAGVSLPLGAFGLCRLYREEESLACRAIYCKGLCSVPALDQEGIAIYAVSTGFLRDHRGCHSPHPQYWAGYGRTTILLTS